MIDLSSLVGNCGEGVVEVFVCPQRVSPDANPMRIGWPTGKAPAVPKLVNVGVPLRVIEYNHRDLTYSYDQGNDAQRVTRKTPLNEAFHQNMWAVCYDEEVLPVHRFPCTQEITKEGVIERLCYRLNNRMFLIIDREGNFDTMYVKYQHAANVDLAKMQDDLDKILRRVMSSH